MARENILMDPTTAALGYGLDYAYTNMERIRLAGLSGDTELNFPMSSGTTNAWGAREAWMTSSPLKEDSDWGPQGVSRTDMGNNHRIDTIPGRERSFHDDASYRSPGAQGNYTDIVRFERNRSCQY